MKTFTTSMMLILLLLTACTQTPISSMTEDNDIELSAINSVKIPDCPSNNSSEECAIRLTDITFEFTGGECNAHDHMIRISSRFQAPAGLGTHPSSKLEWEFLPRGNAGFWLSPVNAPDTVISGTLVDLGCFSFGEQDTLRIYQQLTDGDGHSSNIVFTEIPRPKTKTVSNPNAPSSAGRVETDILN